MSMTGPPQCHDGKNSRHVPVLFDVCIDLWHLSRLSGFGARAGGRRRWGGGGRFGCNICSALIIFFNNFYFNFILENFQLHHSFS